MATWPDHMPGGRATLVPGTLWISAVGQSAVSCRHEYSDSRTADSRSTTDAKTKPQPKAETRAGAAAAHLPKSGGTGDRINNGALNNGAGVAILIEVARALTTAAGRPRRSILVVANTGEEKGLLRAEYFAHYANRPWWKSAFWCVRVSSLRIAARR